MKFKKRLLIYSIIIAALIISSFFWGSLGQSKNMKQARDETKKLENLLFADQRFTDIKFGGSTANFGKTIIIKAAVADQNDLEVLKKIVQENISPKFKVMYLVGIEDQNSQIEQ